jgi:hypothetical protein
MRPREFTASSAAFELPTRDELAATDLAKVLDADLTREQRMKIFGGNLQRVPMPMFRSKGSRS